MKKRFICMLLATALAVSLAVIPVAAENSAENERYIYTYLTTEMGLNTAAACGIMANIYYETNFTADISASGYYGLFMYWSGLTNELINWCANNGKDRTTVEGQMAFFKWKMENSYQSLLADLRALSNTANGAYSSADMFCRQFERPSNMDYECSKRGSFASGTLFPRYAGGSGGDSTELDPEVTVSYSATVTASSLNVRSGPGTSYSVKKSIPRGTKVDIVSEIGSWCELSTGGWVSKTYLSVISDSTPTPEPDPDPTPDPTPDATGTLYRVTAASLYVRSGAGVAHAALGFLHKGDEVTVVETGVDPSSGRTWGKLSTGGWASLTYMTKIGDSTTETPADPEPAPDPTPDATGTLYRVTASSLYVRSGAGVAHAALGFLHKGDEVTVVETGVDPSSGRTWGKLSTGGWASLTYMTRIGDSTTETPSTGTTYTVTASALNIRSGAGSGNAVIGLLWRGTKVTVVATANDASGKPWGQLSTGGWASMAYLQ